VIYKSIGFWLGNLTASGPWGTAPNWRFSSVP